MLISLFIAPATIYIAFLTLLYLTQEKLIFPGAKPNYLLYSKLEDNLEIVESGSYLLQGWKVAGIKPEVDAVVIYFGGNAEDTIQILPLLKQLHVNLVYTFNYRGFGLSEGKPSEYNLYLDAKAIYSHVKSQSPGSRIIIIGNSLGSAVAGYVASVENIDKLILLSPLSSLEEIAKCYFKRILPGFLVKHKFDLKTHVSNVRAECMVILARDDSIIKNEFSMKTFRNLASKKHLIVIPDVDHNDLLNLKSTFEHINKFIVTNRVEQTGSE